MSLPIRLLSLVLAAERSACSAMSQGILGGFFRRSLMIRLDHLLAFANGRT